MAKLSEFAFDEDRNLGVYVCHHVSKEGHPILHVVHDPDGDWQFLCGGDHSDSAEADILCLEHVVADDPSLNKLATMGCNYSATRDALKSEWSVVDESEQLIHDNIAEHGWHIVVIEADDEGPGFAYSIGMKETIEHPEIIVFGLPSRLMGSIINEIGAMVRRGAAPKLGGRIQGLLDSAECILYPVSKDKHREFFGYARWYYKGDNFDALQCFWPGKVDGLFPWEPGGSDYVKSQQPDLRGDS